MRPTPLLALLGALGCTGAPPATTQHDAGPLTPDTSIIIAQCPTGWVDALDLPNCVVCEPTSHAQFPPAIAWDQPCDGAPAGSVCRQTGPLGGVGANGVSFVRAASPTPWSLQSVLVSETAPSDLTATATVFDTDGNILDTTRLVGGTSETPCRIEGAAVGHGRWMLGASGSLWYSEIGALQLHTITSTSASRYSEIEIGDSAWATIAFHRAGMGMTRIDTAPYAADPMIAHNISRSAGPWVGGGLLTFLSDTLSLRDVNGDTTPLVPNHPFVAVGSDGVDLVWTEKSGFGKPTLLMTSPFSSSASAIQPRQLHAFADKDSAQYPITVGCGYAAFYAERTSTVPPDNSALVLARLSDGGVWSLPSVWGPVGLTCDELFVTTKSANYLTLGRIRLDSLGLPK